MTAVIQRMTRATCEMLQAALLATTIAVSAPAFADGPSTSLQSEYLMTLYAPLDAPQAVVQSLQEYNVSSGGWVEGPRIKGRLLAPGADWGRVMPSGVFRIDVRGTIQTDDGALIYVSYNGAVQCSKEQTDRLSKGELMKADDCYFMTAPTFETKAEKYAWLNAVQAVGKMVSFKAGEGSHVRYDIFSMK
jgi:hypothetical protein